MSSTSMKILEEKNIYETAGEHFRPDKNRGNWANKTEFILSCLGYAVGIGNVWRFPYLCYRNGGGAFLVPYILILTTCGIPLFMMELLMGQFSSSGCISVFRLAPLLKGAGFAIVVVNFICSSYYAVIIAYPVLFFIKSLMAKLPWEDCSNSWNTVNCLSISGNSSKPINWNLTSKDLYRTPADEFFHLEVLKISSGIHEIGGIEWPVAGCVLFTWIIIFVCIVKGVKTIGKVVYFTAIFPFVVLGILFVRGITLPGASQGIIFYIYPDWSKLKDARVWSDAAVQVFFSLGTGWGGILNMASYNNFRNNAKVDAILVPIVNGSTSIFAGFVVFSVLGYLSEKTGIPVSKVATSGPGLAFVTYPEAMALMPWPQIWASLFFAMLFFLGLDTAFVQIEAMISSVLDEYEPLRAHKVLVTFGSCATMWLISNLFATNGGMYILQLFDWYSASFTVILICLIEVSIISWTYGINRFADDVYFMSGKKVERIWLICWKYITPAILMAMFITTIIFTRDITFNGYIYPKWAIAIGWISCASSIICIPIYMAYILSKTEGTLNERVLKKLIPVDWHPTSPEIREEYFIFINSTAKEQLDM